MGRTLTKAEIKRALRDENPGKAALFAAALAESGSMTISTLNKLESPKSKMEAFGMAREWKKKNWFVGVILELKAQYATYGLNFTSGDPKQQKQFEKWLTGQDAKTGDAAEAAKTKKQIWLNRYVGNAYQEYFLQDNLVSLWFKADDIESDFPAIQQPERCEYCDTMGVEELKVDFGVQQPAEKKRLLAAGIKESRVNRYAKGMAVMLEEEGEYYLVNTRGTAGQGFAFPRLFSAFRTLTQNESMEVGESLLAYMGRLVIRFHKKGFEPKNNTNLKLKDFMMTPEWSAAVKKFFTPGKFGAADATGNFDHKIEYIWIDPKNYIGTKWETIINRLIWWAGPLGFMMMARSQSLNWMTLFKTEIKSVRRDLNLHIEFVLNSVFTDAPGGIQVSYSDEPFNDTRLLWDMIKTLMQQGAGSLQTAMKTAGLDPAVEGDNNEEERKKENETRFGPPVYDAAHMATRSQLAAATGQLADMKSKKAAKKAGRKTGSKDGDKVT